MFKVPVSRKDVEKVLMLIDVEIARVERQARSPRGHVSLGGAVLRATRNGWTLSGSSDSIRAWFSA